MTKSPNHTSDFNRLPFGPLFDPAADPTPPPAVPAKAPPEAVGGLDPKVKELEAKVASLEAEKIGLTKFKTHTTTLLRDDTPQDAKVTAYREMLADQGVTGAVADAAVARVFGAGTPAETPVAKPDDKANPTMAELADLKATTNRMRLRAIKDEMDHSWVSAQKDPIYTELGKTLEQLGHDADKQKAIMATVAKQVDEKRMNILLDRRTKNNGTFDEDWISEATNLALKEVVEPLRAVIGDASRLGRMPETATGLEALIRKPPVPAPEYKDGDGVSGVTQKLNDFAVDKLLRAAAGLDSGGPSRA